MRLPDDSALEQAFLNAWRAFGPSGQYLEPQTQFRFHPSRQWRMDFAWPAYQVFVEVHGGQWSGGRHSGGSGAEGDAEKQNAAVLDGWLPVVFWTSQIKRDPYGCVQIVIAAIELVNRRRAAMAPRS